MFEPSVNNCSGLIVSQVLIEREKLTSYQNFTDYRIPFGKYTFQFSCKGKSSQRSHPIKFQFVILAICSRLAEKNSL
jgi:hypothetical protein